MREWDVRKQDLDEFDMLGHVKLGMSLPLRILDTLDTHIRKAIVPIEELYEIASKREEKALDAGWVYLKRGQIKEMYDDMVIRCFATSCGCSGQIATVTKKDGFFVHSGHGEAIAVLTPGFGWDFTTGVRGRIMIRKGEFDG